MFLVFLVLFLCNFGALRRLDSLCLLLLSSLYLLLFFSPCLFVSLLFFSCAFPLSLSLFACLHLQAAGQVVSHPLVPWFDTPFLGSIKPTLSKPEATKFVVKTTCGCLAVCPYVCVCMWLLGFCAWFLSALLWPVCLRRAPLHLGGPRGVFL